MYDVATNFTKVKSQIPNNVKLVAISKYHPVEYIKAAYNLGQRAFGESHVQELNTKINELPNDIEWHFIGHLQTNKVKYIAPYIYMIQAVDSVKLMKEINKQATKNNRTINILLELHIAEEETKYGFHLDECREMLQSGILSELNNIHVSGLMMMASNTENKEKIKSEMLLAANFYKEVKEKYFKNDPTFSECSWGMSHDYKIAIGCNSTMVRIGTAIFGPRVY